MHGCLSHGDAGEGHVRHVSTIKNVSTTKLPQYPGQLWHIVDIKNMYLHGGQVYMSIGLGRGFLTSVAFP